MLRNTRKWLEKIYRFLFDNTNSTIQMLFKFNNLLNQRIKTLQNLISSVTTVILRGAGNRGVEKSTQQGALCSVLLTKYHSGGNVKKTETGRICSTYRGEKRCLQGFGGGNLREGDHLEDPGVDERIILKWIVERLDGSID